MNAVAGLGPTTKPKRSADKMVLCQLAEFAHHVRFARNQEGYQPRAKGTGTPATSETETYLQWAPCRGRRRSLTRLPSRSKPLEYAHKVRS
jgi:hypothetical protein